MAENILLTDPILKITAIRFLFCFGVAKINMFYQKARKKKLSVEKDQGSENLLFSDNTKKKQGPPALKLRRARTNVLMN
ncbi:MAG: hypothetical protein R2764_16035 [Bacteroidales bacterium]